MIGLQRIMASFSFLSKFHKCHPVQLYHNDFDLLHCIVLLYYTILFYPLFRFRTFFEWSMILPFDSDTDDGDAACGDDDNDDDGSKFCKTSGSLRSKK